MKSITAAVAVLLLIGVGSTAGAQEAEAQAAREQRRAQPRERAPRSEPAAAPAPVRQERGGDQSRGTDNRGRMRAPRDYADNGGRSEPRERTVERAAAAPATVIARPERRTEPEPERAPVNVGTVQSTAPVASASSDDGQRRSRDDGQRRAVPRGSRPRGDNPAVGRAEPRDGRSYPRDGRSYPGTWSGGSRVYTSRGRVYNNYYYYYPRRWYPYGYGAFGGLGYFYYDPYTWYSYDPYWSRPYSYRYYGSRAYGDDYYYDTGELRLQVHPRHAEVYVDGYFAGHVDDFDGVFQGLRLEEGPYKIEVVAPGYETLVFDVRIIPGRKITYRGELRPRP